MMAKKIYITAVILAVLTILTPIGENVKLQRAQAFLPSLPNISTVIMGKVGGRVTISRLLFCLVGSPPIIIPIPFRLLVVIPPREWPALRNPTRVYTWLLVTKQYKYKVATKVGATVLGNYFPQVDDAIRAVCINGGSLPDADGVLWKVGSVLRGVGDGSRGQAPEETEPDFDPLDPDYADYCDPSSPSGGCIPPRPPPPPNP